MSAKQPQHLKKKRSQSFLDKYDLAELVSACRKLETGNLNEGRRSIEAVLDEVKPDWRELP